MLTLAAADTLAAGAEAATTVTCTVMGMELAGTTEVYKVLDQRQLAAAPATIYTVPGGNTAFVKSILVVNTNTTLTRTFQMFRGGTAAANAITPVFTLDPGGCAVYEDGKGWSFYNAAGQEMSTASRIQTDTPSWYGQLYAAYGRCDPQQILRMAQMVGSVAPTPTNISTTVARIAYFRPPADITVNKVRYYGVGATTNVYRIAIYNGDTLARLTAETAFTTAATTWGEIFNNLGLNLLSGQLYFIACSVNATGTTAGILAMAPTLAATTGQIAVLPKSWPGNLDLDTGYMDGGFAQGAVTAGALPDPFPTVAAQSAWTGGMPAFFLDNNNA